MATATRGLTPADLTTIRDALAGGRKPKVVFTSSAGQMAGNVGQVVELGDPGGSDEWIVVQFGRDQLPFSPADLAIPTRAAAAQRPSKRAETKASTTPAPAAAPPGPPLLDPPAPAARREARVKQTTPPTAPAPAVNGSAPVLKEEAPKPAKVAKPKPPASLVVTLAYTDREWTIAATHGSRALAKPYPIKPTEALRMVALIDMPGLHDAVENIIAAERVEAEHRAVRLREELAEIESRLAELAARG
jgi:hypothetical protein